MPFGERRYLDREYIDTEEQVGTKPSFIYPCLNVLVCGTDKAEVHLYLIIAADTLVALLL